MSDMSAAPGAAQGQSQGQDSDDDSSTVSVEIELNTKTGEVKVGVEPPDGTEAGDDDSYLQPAKSIDDAIAQAKQLLHQASGQQSPEDEAAFGQGYANVAQGQNGSGY